MSDCPFCAFVKNHFPSDSVAEVHDGWMVVNPLNPFCEGHKLIVPFEHVKDVRRDPVLFGKMSELAANYLKDVGAEGNIITSCGSKPTQTVEHLHIHIIPRKNVSEIPKGWPWKG